MSTISEDRTIGHLSALFSSYYSGKQRLNFNYKLSKNYDEDHKLVCNIRLQRNC